MPGGRSSIPPSFHFSRQKKRRGKKLTVDFPARVMWNIDFRVRWDRMQDTFEGITSVSASPAMKIIRETSFAGLSPAARGKVRDIYDLGDRLLIVATDRLSAFDVVMPTPIPDKGRVLTQLSLFWFK